MLKEFFNVSQYPAFSADADNLFKQQVITVIKVFILLFFVSIALSGSSHFVDVFITKVLHYKSIRRQYNFTFQQIIKRLGVIKALIFVCVLGPILEECTFRLFLSFKKTHISLGIAFAFFTLINFFPFVKNLNIQLGFPIALLVKIIVSVFLFLISQKMLKPDFHLADKTKTRFIITSICVFGLMHISNFAPLQWAIIGVYPLFVLPQLFIGWGLTYIRLKNGFFWGFALHVLINATSMAFYFNVKS